jgi:hypothetical protein
MKLRKLLALVLLIAAVSFVGVGCQTNGEDKKSDHPASEHPSEHPDHDHADSEHPSEHPDK